MERLGFAPRTRPCKGRIIAVSLSPHVYCSSLNLAAHSFGCVGRTRTSNLPSNNRPRYLCATTQQSVLTAAQLWSRRQESNLRDFVTSEVCDPHTAARTSELPGAAGGTRTRCGRFTRAARGLHSAAPLPFSQHRRQNLNLCPKPARGTGWVALRHLGIGHISLEPLEGIEPSPAPYRGAVRSIKHWSGTSFLERKMGIEPTFRAWHARALPLSYIRP